MKTDFTPDGEIPFEQTRRIGAVDVCLPGRLYNDSQWPNPVVIKTTQIQAVK